MSPQPHDITREAAEELERLLRELRVTRAVADARYGDYWCVYAHPAPSEEGEEWFDVLLSVRPRSADASYTAAELRFELRQEQEPGISVFKLPSGPANQRGQTWFKGLAAEAYSAATDSKLLYSRIVAVEEENAPLTAAAAGLEEIDSLTFILPDPRIRGHMERAPDGRAVLTLMTEADALEDTEVRFAFGDEEGEVRLEGTGVEGLREAVYRLRQSFAEACRCVPEFEVMAHQRD